MVGPVDDKIRVLVSFIEPAGDSYKMQSMIIDINKIKDKKEPPSSVNVDLTSTIRSLSNGEKKQKVLILRWQKNGEIELRCDGKWTKQSSESSIDKIIEATNAVIRNVPLNAKEPTDATLPPEVEKKVSVLLNALHTENFPCLRTIN